MCNLGSINLYAFCKRRRQYKGKQSIYFDWERLKEVARTALNMLENVIDITEFNSSRVQDRIRENRRVGLGIMGFADACYAMRIRYGSDKAEKFAEKIMGLITEEAEKKSAELAQVRGSFPNIELSVFAGKGPMRNAACTTVAPTGTISAFTGVCGGCEPYFAPAYSYQNVLQIGANKVAWVEQAMKECCRHSEVGEMKAMAEEIDYQLRIGPHREFVSWMSELGRDVHAPLHTLGQQVLNEAAEEWLNGLPKGITPSTTLYDAVMQQSSYGPFAAVIPAEVLWVHVTAQEIPVEQHIKMQAAFQRRTNNSISKTLNLPNKATVKDVRDTIELAWRSRLKGCTMYRDGSRQEQVLNLNTRDEGDNVKHKPANHYRFQDLIHNASSEEYRTLFNSTKGELVTVEMTPSELEVSLRSNITRNQRRHESKAHRDFQKQMKALEQGLAGVKIEEEESTDNSSDDEPVACSSSSSSSSSSLKSSVTPPGRSIDLRVSMDGSPMCTRAGCGSE